MPQVLRSLARRALAILAVGALLGASVVVLGAPTAAEAATHAVSGVVYRDFDGDGTRDTTGTGVNGVQVDSGLAGVAVTITDAHGTNWTGTTGTTGTYSISVVDPFTTKLRVSFTPPAPYKASTHGTGNRTSVQFIDVSTTQNAVNYGVNVAEDYAPNNPPLVTAFQYSGLSSSANLANRPSLSANSWSQNYDLATEPNWAAGGGAGTYPGRTNLATVPQTGALWGNAYDYKTDSVFASAVYKRQAALGPLGIGGIYRVSDVLATNGTVNAWTNTSKDWLDVSTIGIDVDGPTAPPVNGAGGRGLDDPQDPANDSDAFARAGKIGIGGIAIDAQTRKLYLINLYDRKLYAINIDTPTAANVQSWDLGLSAGQRPWALELHRGTLYVGIVDSGEATPGGQATGNFTVKSAPVSAPSTWTEVLTSTLNYTKGAVAPVVTPPNGDQTKSVRWNNWVDTWSAVAPATWGDVDSIGWTNSRIHLFPQAMLTDLDFDEKGYLILGVTDRTSLQGGNRNYATTGTTTYETIASGDLLIASPDGDGTFTMENDGTVGTRTTTSGEDNQGPGGQEFFNDWHELGTGDYHHEIGLGAVATLAGVSTVVSTVYDPLEEIRVVGANWFDLNTGAPLAGYQHNLNPGTGATSTYGSFQKGGGLGDINVIALAAPLEIGNRLWFDGDQDGVQDADEPAVPAVTVQLFQGTGTTPIASTTTDANGEYYFSSASITQFAPNGGAYTVKFVKPTSGDLFTSNATYGTVPWSIVNFTTPNVGTNDNIDSDAIASGGDATIAYTAGAPGDNDHSLDAGLVANAYFSVTKTIDAAGATPAVGDTFAMTAQARDFRGDAITLAAADASFTLAANATKVISLPVGSDALVAETSTTGIHTTTVTPASWFDVVGTSAAPTAVTVLNRLYRPGTFSVTKALSGTGAAIVPGATSFALEYSSNGGGSWTQLTVTPGSTTSAVTLPYDTDVRVREVTPLPVVPGVTWGTPAWSGTGVTTVSGEARFKIGDATSVAVTLTNPSTRQNVGFSVTKAVTGTGATTVPGTQNFTVNYNYPNGASTVSGTLTVSKNTPTASLGAVVPYGTIVTLSEVTPTGPTSVAFGTPVFSGTGVTNNGDGTATFVAGATTAITLTNPATLLNGSFTVTKSVTGTGAALGSAAGPFTVEYSTTGGAPWSTLSVPPGGTSSSVTLPFGTNVTVREVAPSAVTGITWGTPVWSGTGVTATGNLATFTVGNGTTLALGLENPTTLLNGQFTVTKSVTGSGAALGSTAGPFTVEYSTTGGAPWSTLSVPANGTSASVSLPYGSTVTVREVAPSAVTGITWGTPVWSGTGVTAGAGNTATFTIGAGTTVAVGLENPTTLLNGSFTVTKAVTGDGATLGTTAGPFTVEYSTTGGAPWSSLSVPANGTSASVTLPYGTAVTVREVAPSAVTGITWGTPVWSGTGVTAGAGNTATLTIGASTTVAIGLENPANRIRTGFTVTKSVTGLGEPIVPGGTSFTVNYAYVDGAVPTTGSLTVTKGSPVATLGNVIPYGATVTITEVVPAGISGMAWGTPVFTGAGVTDNGNGTATFVAGVSSLSIQLENPTTRFGGFTVTKAVTGSASASVPNDFAFTVNYSYILNSVLTSGQLTLSKDAPTQGLSGIPYGTVVTLTEVAPSALSGVRWDPKVWSGTGVSSAGGIAQLTIGSSPTVAVGLENPTTLLSGFTVTKAVTGSGASLVPNSHPFTVHYSYTVDSVLTTGQFTLTKSAPTQGLTGLPLGTVVTLTEDAPGALTDVRWDSKVWTGAPSAGGVATVTIGSTGTVAVGLENPTTRLGGFTVTKSVTGSAASLVPSDFAFTVDYSYPSGSGTTTGQLVLSKDDPTQSLSGIPYGTVVTLTEAAPTGAPAAVRWDGEIWSGSGVTSAGGAATLTIGSSPTVAVGLENPTTLLNGFTVTKLVSGSGASQVADDFEFTVHYSYTVDSVLTTGDLLLTKGDPTQSVTGIPLGTVVTLTEEAPTGGPANVLWGSASWSGSGVTSAAGEATLTIGSGAAVAVGLENPTTRLGEFTVTKSVSGSAAAAIPNDFEFTVDYSYTVDSVFHTGQLVLTKDDPTQGISGIPYGTVVTLTEVAPAALTDVRWDSKVWSGTGVSSVGGVATLTIGSSPVVTVSLENPATRLGGFTVTKSVTGLGTSAVPNNFEFTVNYSYTVDSVETTGQLVLTKSSPTQAVAGIPYGTEVTLTEDVPTGGPADVLWGSRIWSGAGVTSTSGVATLTIGPSSVVTVGLENPTTRVGGFTVTKSVTGSAATTVADDFEFTVNYSYILNSVLTSGQLVLTKDAPTLGLSGIPYGTVVTLTETAPSALTGVRWDPKVWSGFGVSSSGGVATLTIGTNPVIAVGLENPATLLNGFWVTKSVTGSGEWLVPDDFEFTVNYSYPSGSGTTSGQLVLTKDAPTQGLTDLPVGTVVTLTEDAPGSIAGLRWDPKVWSGSGVTSSGGAATLTIGSSYFVTVGLENPTTALGNFTVTKTVSGSAVTSVPDDFEFTVNYSYTVDSVLMEGQLVLTKDDPTQGLNGIPYGTVVTLTEDVPGTLSGVRWDQHLWSGPGVSSSGGIATLTIGSSPTVTVGLENMTTLLSGFTVTKQVSGSGAALIADDFEFTVNYSYPSGSGTASGQLVLTKDAPTHGLTDIPYGTVVTLTEDAPTGGPADVVWGSRIWSGAGVTGSGGVAFITIGSSPTVAVQLENPATRVGGFTVTKSVTGSANSLVPNDFAFTVNYSYILNSVLTTGQLVLSKDSPTQFLTGLPYGTVVTLTENTPGALADVRWDPKIWSGSGVSSAGGIAQLTIGSSPTVAVALENPTTRLGGFTVTKAVTGSGEPLLPGNFGFTVDYSYTVGTVTTTGQLLLSKDAPTSGLNGIPYGTVVTLTEAAPGAFANVRWDPKVWSGTGVTSSAGTATLTIGSSPVVAVGLENPTTRLGGFAVTKTVSGSANSLVPDDFEFTVNYSYPSGSGTLTGQLVLTKDDPTQALNGLPYGTVVTLTEDAPGALTGVRWDPKVWSGAGVSSAGGVATLTIGSDFTVFVGLENPTTRLSGFSVTKIVTGDAAGSVPSDFVFHVTYSYGAATGEFQLTKAAPTASLTGLPVGTVVTLTETAPTGGPVDVAWGTPAFSVDGGTPASSATFTIGATPVAVVLDNHTDRLLGSFSVTKLVSGSAALSVPNDFEFTVHYSYTVDGVLTTDQFTLTKNAPTQGLSGLPYGTVVTLTEDDPTGAPVDVQWTGKNWSGLGVSSSAGVATLTIGSSPVATGLENTTTQLVGDLKISKSVTGSALGSVPTGFDFTVHYSYGSTFGDLTIEDGGFAMLTGVPAGTVVTLSEAPRVGAPSDVQWETPIWRHGSVTDSGTTTVTVVAGTEVEVALENPTTRLYNGFSITKVVTGDAAASVPNDFEFTVTYSPAGTPAGPLVLTKAAPTASVTDLPLGTVVTLKETAPGSAAPDVAWGAPVFTGTTFTSNPDGSVSFTVGSAPIAIVLTNPTTRLYGDFSILKDVTGPAEDTLDDDFEFTGTYSYSGISPVPFTIENGQTWTLPYADRIPAGTTVTVTETTPLGGLPALSGWGTPVFSGAGVTGSGPGSATFVIGANTTIALGLENPTTVTPRVDIEKGDGAGSVIAHDADTMPDGEHYQPGETRTIVFRVTNTGTEDLRQVLLTDDTLSGAEVEGISWAFPDGSSANAALVGEDWVAHWTATFGSGTSSWVPGDVIIGTATLTVDVADDAHVDNARVDAVGRYSGTPVEDEDAYNAFTGDIQIIKYDGRIAGPTVQSGGDWVVPAKPLANPFQDANDVAHAAQSIANVPVRIDWVVTNIGTTTLTDVMVSDTTLLGPSIDAWTCDLSDVGGPAVYSFLDDGPWAGLLEPSASFFCTGSVTLVAGGKHTDVADVEAHVIFPEVDGDSLPTGNPMLDGDDLPVLALDDLGEPIVVDDDDPFLDPAAVERAFTGVEPWMPLAAGIAVLSVLLGVLAVALPRRRRSVARHR